LLNEDTTTWLLRIATNYGVAEYN